MAYRKENFILVIVIFLVIINITGIVIPVWHTKEHGLNVTVIDSGQCVVHVRIQEGLWQRFCRESRMEDNTCQTDVQKWCDNLKFSDYNSFVIALQTLGDFTLCFVFGTIIKSKCSQKKFHLEMAAAEIGLGGLLMIIGALVYAATDAATDDGQQLGYNLTDLHVGWGLCVSGAGLAIITCIYTMCAYVKMTKLPVPSTNQSFPIFDDDDEDLISAR